MRRGFTLIELLVVIAIITILAAILFPVLAESRESGRQTVCLSNMRQIGMAMRMYVSDNDETWFPASTLEPLPGWPHPQKIWIGYDNSNYPLDGCFYGRVYEPAQRAPRPGLIDPYIRNEGVKRCPSMPSRWQMSYAFNWFSPYFSSGYYGRNPAARNNEYSPAAKQLLIIGGACYAIAAPDAEVEEPARTLIMWEHLARVPMCNFLQPADWPQRGREWEQGPPRLDYLINHFNFLHRKGANSLWADGHARRILYDQLRRPMFSTKKHIYNL